MSNTTPSPPCVMLLLDTEAGERGDRLAERIGACGIETVRARTVDELQHTLVHRNPGLIGLLDSGESTDECLAALSQAKLSGWHRQLFLFTERANDPWAVDCVRSHAVDQVLSPAAEVESLRVAIAAAERSAMLMQELIAANHNLTKSSKTDALTGLYNHGHIMEWLRIEHKRAARDLDTLCAVMVDLDYFKFINDTYGHRFGDLVLRETAANLKASLRDSDIIGRYGGEEFLILAPKTDSIGGRQLAEKLRQTIEATIYRDGVFDVKLSASFGVATTEHSAATTPELLLQLADKALFEAKESGRNRVVVAQSDTDSHSAAVRQEIEAKAGEHSGQPTVLVVERSPLMLEMLCSHVRTMGVRTVEATTAAEALALLKDLSPDCILLDVHLPDIDGYELCRKVRAMFRDAHVPVIFVTSETGLGSHLQGYESGADDYLTKPIVREHLVAKVQAQIRVKALQDRLRAANAKIKQAQRTLMRAERLQAVGQLAGGIAHDFNNILSSLLGHTQRMLINAPEGSDLARGLSSIEEILDQGAETIRRLLFFTRDEERGRRQPREVNLAALLRDCLEIARPRWKDEAERRGLSYAVETDLDESLTLTCHPRDLREVFTAIIFNALDAMPGGGDLTVRTAPKGPREALIEIHDSGCGMSPDVQRHMYDPFFSTKGGSGAGLGLSIAYGVIGRMEGHIECVSHVKVGTTFRITLPCAVEVCEPISVPPISEADSKRLVETTSGEEMPSRLLVIDDEPHIREVFSEILRDQGHVVRVAEDGESGLEQFMRSPADIVITDLGMPGISGWEVAQRIRRTSPHTKIVLTSGWGDQVESEAPERGLIDRMLPKPVSLRDLLTCVEGLLRESASAPSPSASELA